MNVDQSTGLGWSESELAAAGVSEMRDLYTSPDFWALEKRLFWESWSLVASAEQVGPGRYLAVTVAGAPIVLWRDGDRRVRAFHNLCRHRSMPLVSGAGPIGRFVTCPYHHWTYNLDGDLVRIPQPDQFRRVDVGDLGLRPVPVLDWHGMIFVCLASEPPDFDQDMGPLRDKLANYLALPLVEVARAEYTVECNWKLLVENHVDVYHLWYLHQRSLAAYRHTAFEWQWDGLTWWSLEPLKDPSLAGPGLDGLGDKERFGIGAHLLFPNLMVVTTGQYLATYDARPIGPSRTAMTLRIRSTPDRDGDALVESVRAFLAEDVTACEALQIATRSPFFQIGPTAISYEEPVQMFHAQLRSKLLAV